jgi:Fic family protein
MYIYENRDWPGFTWNDKQLLIPLSNVRNLQGRLIGRMEAIGFNLREEAMLETLTIDVIKSNEIEGELLNPEKVRSSIARRLGMDIAGLIPSDRNIDGLIEMMMDATKNYTESLTKERLCNWHAAMFPAGRSGIHKITVADWRHDDTGPMQVVSGPMGKEKVHYQAPAAELVEGEMKRFLEWYNNDTPHEPVIKAGIAHLWFVTIHPFDDGTGRIARTIADMQLARADNTNQRFYSMSAQIERTKKMYYEILEKTQHGTMDITIWLEWFIHCLIEALEATDTMLAKVLTKVRFWERNALIGLNDRQKLMINKLFENFTGKLNTSKWAKITKCSQDTALRDIQDLIEKGILTKAPGGGRSTSYILT